MKWPKKDGKRVIPQPEYVPAGVPPSDAAMADETSQLRLEDVPAGATNDDPMKIDDDDGYSGDKE